MMSRNVEEMGRSRGRNGLREGGGGINSRIMETAGERRLAAANVTVVLIYRD